MQARTDKPLFILGHSMGGLVTTTFLLKNPNLKIAGVILSAPFFGFDEGQGLSNPIRFASLAAVAHHANVSMNKYVDLTFDYLNL